MVAKTQLVTAEMLEHIPQSDAHVELVKGEVITMPPAGYEHGAVALSIAYRLKEFVLKHKLGQVFAAETGFILARDPDTVRAPGAAFVASERLELQKSREGFFEGPPDLAVEVVSPGDSDEEVEAKVLDYLSSGVRLIWVVRPRTRTATAYRSLTQIRLLREADLLEGEDVLPGFSMTASEIFE